MSKKRGGTREMARREAVFMDFHENSQWARDKIASGTLGLTLEATAFMEAEIVERNRRRAVHDKVAKEIADEEAKQRAATL
jgi:hypothetical protein